MLGLKTEITGVVTENASAIGLSFAASKPVPTTRCDGSRLSGSLRPDLVVGVSWSNFQEERWRTDEAAIKAGVKQRQGVRPAKH